MIKYIEKYPLASISIFTILLLVVNLGIPEVTIMEARNFITAREMIQDDHWLLTTMNGEARYQKPPLPTWLTAISGLIFGANSLFALRLPAALMVLCLGITCYFFTKELKFSKKQRLYSSLILITSFYVFAIINEAPWDIFAHGFMALGLLFLFKFFKNEFVNWKNVLLIGVFIGLSIMSKGPVSLYALFLPFVIAYGIVFKFQNLKLKIFPIIIFILLFLVIGGWWFVYVRIVDSETFLAVATKETGNWSSYNVRPFYYYWSFFSQSGIWTIPAFVGLLYPYLIKRVKNKKAYQFSFLWTLLSVILLSIIPEKKARYLMPVLIPLALNTSFYINYLINEFSNWKSKKETLVIYLHFGLVGTLGLLAPIGLYFLLKEAISEYLISFSLTSISLFLIGYLIWRNLLKKNVEPIFYYTTLFVISVFLFGLPLSKHFNKNEEYNSIATLKILEEKHQIKTFAFEEIAPELIWDYNGKIQNIYKNNQIILPKEGKFGLLLMNKDTSLIKVELSPNYTFKNIETYNINFGTKQKERLIRQFYLVSKK
jgi:4-amino-4-deoxy-L-arabinose transferase-like glycosyltransferase